MADLESAATEALDGVRTAASAVVSARARLDALATRVEEMHRQVQADWDRLDEQARVFSEATAEQATHVAQASDGAGTALVELKGDAEQTMGSGASEIEASQEHTSSLTEQFAAAQPRLEQVRTALDEAVASLESQAAGVASDLESALAEAREFLEVELTDGLQSLADEVSERTRALGEALDRGADELRDAYQAWSDGLERVETALVVESTSIDEELTENVDLACDRCADAYRAAFEATSARVREVEAVLRGLEAAAAEADGGSAPLAAPLEEALGRAVEGWQGAQQALEAAVAVLARYSFVTP